jgi:hypothetical protein
MIEFAPILKSSIDCSADLGYDRLLSNQMVEGRRDGVIYFI